VLKKRLFWIYFLTIFFILGFTIYFRTFIYSYAILPFAQFFWAIFRMFAGLNQKVYWYLLVVLIIFLTYRIIYSLPKSTQDKYSNELNTSKSREQFWLKTISSAIDNREGSREYLRWQLAQLFLSASNLSPLAKVENPKILLMGVQPPLPTKLLSLFQECDDEYKKRFPGVDLVFAFMWWKKYQSRDAACNEINEILQSMEDYLEIDYENEPSR
jgi:hypothetical protein